MLNKWTNYIYVHQLTFDKFYCFWLHIADTNCSTYLMLRSLLLNCHNDDNVYIFIKFVHYSRYVYLNYEYILIYIYIFCIWCIRMHNIIYLPRYKYTHIHHTYIHICICMYIMLVLGIVLPRLVVSMVSIFRAFY